MTAAPRAAAIARTWWAHRVEYGAEALGLGLFMVSACAFGTLLEHPASPVHRVLPDADVRRALMGVAMGLTAVGMIHSPWGRRSGAHLNPATSIAFWRLGRVRGADLAGYVAAQFAGATLGVAAMSLLLGAALADPHVHDVATRPGPWGSGPAFAAEAAMAFTLLSVVLRFAAQPRLERWTGLAAGVLVALDIFFGAPVSGTSLNPARTFGSSLAAHDWTAWWVYASAPVLGTLAATELLLVESHLRGRPVGGCAKLDHSPNVPCIFCGRGLETSSETPGTSAREPSLEALGRP